MRYFMIALLALLIVGCELSDDRPEHEKVLRVFKDKKIKTMFPEEPEMLPIEDVFIGNGIGKKRTYLINDSDSVSFMICNITTDEYDDASIENLIEEFKESYMITDFDPIFESDFNRMNYYKAASPMSEKYFYVKFGDGVESSDVFYAMTIGQEEYPDSTMSWYFLDNTTNAYGY